MQGTQQQPTGDRESETTTRKRLKITFKRLREEPTLEEIREDTDNEAYLLQQKKYGRVVSDTDNTEVRQGNILYAPLRSTMGRRVYPSH